MSVTFEDRWWCGIDKMKNTRWRTNNILFGNVDELMLGFFGEAGEKVE